MAANYTDKSTPRDASDHQRVYPSQSLQPESTLHNPSSRLFHPYRSPFVPHFRQLTGSHTQATPTTPKTRHKKTYKRTCSRFCGALGRVVSQRTWTRHAECRFEDEIRNRRQDKHLSLPAGGSGGQATSHSHEGPSVVTGSEVGDNEHGGHKNPPDGLADEVHHSGCSKTNAIDRAG